MSQNLASNIQVFASALIVRQAARLLLNEHAVILQMFATAVNDVDSIHNEDSRKDTSVL
jgi:hypothetical protein